MISTKALFIALVRLEQRTFWRNRQAAIFAFGLPLIFVAIFPSLFSDSAHPGTPFKAYFVAGMVGVAIVSATYTTMAISLTFQRDLLNLKRLRATPLTPSIIFAAKIASAEIVVVAQLVTMLSLGRIAYDIRLPINWLTFLVFVIIGSASFAAIGIGLCGLIPNSDSAPAIVQLPYITLQFISGVFFPLNSGPNWLRYVASVFPLRWLVDGLRAGYLGLDFVHGERISGEFIPNRVAGLTSLTSQWAGLVVIIAWTILGVLVALRWFKWERRTR